MALEGALDSMSGHRLSELAPEHMSEAQLAAYEATQARRGGTRLVGGRVAGPLRVWLHAPVVGNAQQAFGAVLRFELTLSARVRELAILSVAHDVGSEFQILAHERMAYDAGLTLEQLDALRDHGEPPLEDPVERAAWQTTNRILTEGDLTDDEFTKAAETLGQEGLVELVTLIGYYRLLALQMRICRVPAEDYKGPTVPDPR